MNNEILAEMINLLASDLCKASNCWRCKAYDECLKHERIGTDNLKRYYFKLAEERISNNE